MGSLEEVDTDTATEGISAVSVEVCTIAVSVEFHGVFDAV